MPGFLAQCTFDLHSLYTIEYQPDRMSLILPENIGWILASIQRNDWWDAIYLNDKALKSTEPEIDSGWGVKDTGNPDSYVPLNFRS